VADTPSKQCFFEWVLTTFVLIVLRHGPVLRQHAST
jgi:hypothetical protein